jgi:hypothetical protein
MKGEKMNLVKTADFKIKGKHFEIVAVWKFNGKITTVEFKEINNPDKTFEMSIEQFMERTGNIFDYSAIKYLLP